MDKIRQKSQFQNRGLIGRISNILLTVVTVWIFNYTHVRYYRETTYYFKGNFLFLLLYGSMLVLFLAVYGAYRIRQYRTRELAFSFAMASFLTNVLTYFVMCLIAKRMLNVTALAVTTLIQWVVAVGIYVLSRILLPVLEPDVEVLFVSRNGKEEPGIWNRFDRRHTSYRIGKAVSGDLPREELYRAMETYGAVLLGDMDPDLRQDLIGHCFRTGRKVLLAPSMTDIVIGSAQPMVIGDFLLYDLNTQESDTLYLAAKRILDVISSALGLLILSPLMLLTALAIRLQDGGPVFYRQTRLTEGGREFLLTKFRSMIVDAEKVTGAVLAGKTDPRITPVGRLIRATRIDELPQLWNILRGDMTLVGPRPERPEFYEQICAEYPEFSYRLKVKAGLTGYAQLYGKYNTSFADKARLDMYYIQHASFLWDLQLIFYTLKIIFIRESTEGVATEVSAGKTRDTETADR